MFQLIKVNANRARESHDELFQISFCDLLGITRFPIISAAFELFKQSNHGGDAFVRLVLLALQNSLGRLERLLL